MPSRRIFGSVCALFAIFMFGMWLGGPVFSALSNPSAFPIGLKFAAVSLNGAPLIPSNASKLATLEVKGRWTLRHRVGGNSFCQDWGGHVTLLPTRQIVWGEIFVQALGCASAMESDSDEKFLRALLSARWWRTEKGTLILDNGTDILRFKLAPH